MEKHQRIFRRRQTKTFISKKIIRLILLSFLFIGTGLFASTSVNKKQNKIIKKYILQCELNNEKACDNLFFEYLKEKKYNKAAEIGWQNFYEGYFNTLPYMADLITTNKTKYKNCRFGLLLLEAAIKSKKCEAFKILSKWYKEGRCTNKPNVQKSQKYYTIYLKCKKKYTQKKEK